MINRVSHLVGLVSLSGILCFHATPGLAQRLPERTPAVSPELAMVDGVLVPSAGQGMKAGGKSPGTAALISFLITGGGQVYNEETVKGVVMLLLGVGFTVLAVDGVDEYDCDPTETCYPWMLPVGLIGGLTVKIWSIFDAASGAHRWNRAHGVGMLQVAPSLALVPLEDGVGIRVLRAGF